MAMRNLEDLYMEQLQDLYSAETQLLDALPKMAEAARNGELRNAFKRHLEETRRQKERLERIFDSHGGDPNGKTCRGMEGLIEEGSEMMSEEGEDAVRDAGIIAAAQRVEHYEIAGYGSARTFAQRLGYDEDANLLQETLREEADADQNLTSIAESTVNPKAEAEDARD